MSRPLLTIRPAIHARPAPRRQVRSPVRPPLRSSPRRRVVQLEELRREHPQRTFSGEQIDSFILQGMILLAIVGMLAWFHQPLGAAMKGIFGAIF